VAISSFYLFVIVLRNVEIPKSAYYYKCILCSTAVNIVKEMIFLSNHEIHQICSKKFMFGALTILF